MTQAKIQKNGSQVSSPAPSPDHMLTIEPGTIGNRDTETPTTPPGAEFQIVSDVMPKQNTSYRAEGQSARDLGLRAMDYLSSRSSLQQLQAREVAENGEYGREDLGAASPYSVD